MKVIGIVGGAASGKSSVGECLRQLGAELLDADRAGHEVLREPAVKAAAADRWGDSIVDSNGEIDRKQLAEIVFAEGNHARRELSYLEQLTHPRIRIKLEKQLETARQTNQSAVLLDAALLFESGWNELCDTVLFVETPEEARRRRAEQRGWTADEWSRRETAQCPIEEKRQRSDWQIDNGGTREQTEQQVRTFWDSLFRDDVTD